MWRPSSGAGACRAIAPPRRSAPPLASLWQTVPTVRATLPRVLVAAVVAAVVTFGPWPTTTRASGDRVPWISSSSRAVFRLVPGRNRVDVTVDMTVTNRSRQFFITQWQFFAVMGAQRVRFSGASGQVVGQHGELIRYALTYPPLYPGQTRRIRATYRLPGGAPRTGTRTRVTPAYAHFCWHGQVTDTGTVTAILPRAFDSVTQHGAVRTRRVGDRIEITARRTRSPGQFYACTDAFRPGRLQRAETTSPGGQTVVVEGWPDDPEWTPRMVATLDDILPRLEDLAGSPIPGDSLIVRQVASQALGPYAGDFSHRTGQVRVSEFHGSPLLIAHEVAHAWFNPTTMRGVWMPEGHAEWSARAVHGMDCEPHGPWPGRGQPRLRDWRYMGAQPDPVVRAIVTYQYAAACTIVQTVARLMGEDAMREVHRALLERTPKYGGTPVRRPPRPDWREWLDAVDEVGLVPAGVADLDAAERVLVEFGVARPRDLRGRASARAAYHEAMAVLGEGMPALVRDLMDDWRFGRATNALEPAVEAMRLARLVDGATGTSLADDLAPRLAATGSMGQLRSLRNEIRRLAAEAGVDPDADPEAGAGLDADAPDTSLDEAA
jgi:hypothetical protein